MPALRPYPQLVKYCRRLSALAVNGVLLLSLTNGSSALAAVWKTVTDELPSFPGFSSGRQASLLLVVWYAFLSQLKFRWAVWLPIYLVFFPVFWTIGNLFKFLGKPLLTRAQALANEGGPAIVAASSKKTSFPTKRIWLLLFFAWFVALRSLHATWAAWIPPFLAVPVWLWCLKLAYRSATSPATLAEALLKGTLGALENAIKTLNEAKIGKVKTAPSSNSFLRGFGRLILQHYKDDEVLAVIQREAIIVFSAALLLAVAISAFVRGLTGRAFLHTAPDAFSSYAFFSTGSLPECVLWAVGCMTTSRAFPGATAPVWLKAAHALILATGIFQLTYLLACFQITANTKGQRTMEKAVGLTQSTAAKLDECQALEAEKIATGPVKPDNP